MRIDILTLFPEMFTGPLTESIIQKARDKKIVEIDISDIRSFTSDKHHAADDRPFGGGPGMVMKVEPISKALKHAGAPLRCAGSEWPSIAKPLVVYMSPQGKTLSQSMVRKLAGYKHLILLCGHYEGVDERVMRWVNQEISIGDYVLTGGEIPAMALVDSVVRMLPGAVKESGSVEQDSFFKGLLDYPHYTRPAKFKNISVPKILFSGHHARIDEWRKMQSLLATASKRPDLLKNIKLSEQEKKMLSSVKGKRPCR